MNDPSQPLDTNSSHELLRGATHAIGSQLPIEGVLRALAEESSSPRLRQLATQPLYLYFGHCRPSLQLQKALT